MKISNTTEETRRQVLHLLRVVNALDSPRTVLKARRILWDNWGLHQHLRAFNRDAARLIAQYTLDWYHAYGAFNVKTLQEGPAAMVRQGVKSLNRSLLRE